jgi:hypothetical protein
VTSAFNQTTKHRDSGPEQGGEDGGFHSSGRLPDAIKNIAEPKKSKEWSDGADIARRLSARQGPGNCLK